MPAISSDGLQVCRHRSRAESPVSSEPGQFRRRSASRTGADGEKPARPGRRRGQERARIGLMAGPDHGLVEADRVAASPSNGQSKTKRARPQDDLEASRPARMPSRRHKQRRAAGRAACDATKPGRAHRARTATAASRVRDQRRRRVAKCRSQPPSHDLGVNQAEHDRATRTQMVRIHAGGRIAVPVAAGEDAKRDHQAEEGLAGAAVDGRQERRTPASPGYRRARPGRSPRPAPTTPSPFIQRRGSNASSQPASTIVARPTAAP